MGFRNAVLVARIAEVHLPLTNLLLKQQGLLILVQLQPDALTDNESSYYFQHRNFLHKQKIISHQNQFHWQFLP